MRCRIHRGCREIGGNCVEVEFQGARILLDLGLPLNPTSEDPLPAVSGLTEPDSSLLGIFISHSHPDHYGLLERVTQRVPVFMGTRARKMLDVMAFFTPLPGLGGLSTSPLHDRCPVHLGPFTITPLAIDHSAHESYCLLVSAGGKHLLYSGDLRGHGRSCHLFDRLIQDPPGPVDVFLCEGTHAGHIAGFDYPDERAVADGMTRHFSETLGMCLVWCSSPNLDRLISIHQAAQRARRRLIIDVYTAELLRVSGDESLPHPGTDGVQVYLPRSQRSRIVAASAFDRVRPYYPHRIYPERLAKAARTSVMLFRPSMLPELLEADCLKDAALVTSLWSGYARRCETELRRLSQRAGVPRYHVHTSGHATEPELRRLIQAIPAPRVIPIHLEAREAFAALSDRVEFRDNMEWWEV